MLQQEILKMFEELIGNYSKELLNNKKDENDDNEEDDVNKELEEMQKTINEDEVNKELEEMQKTINNQNNVVDNNNITNPTNQTNQDSIPTVHRIRFQSEGSKSNI